MNNERSIYSLLVLADETISRAAGGQLVGTFTLGFFDFLSFLFIVCLVLGRDSSTSSLLAFFFVHISLILHRAA